jgi:integrase
MLKELDEQGSKSLEAASMTFIDLAEYYKENYLLAPQYVDGRKIRGLRSVRSVKARWQTLKDYFRNKKLRSITFGNLEKFKATRLSIPTRSNKPRSITSVNRELEVLRTMLNIALREGWMLKNPFSSGVLLSKADEKKRERIISREEEDRLLIACTGRRKHLRPIIVMALDTGMRRGEILSIKWSDIDFDNRTINIRAFITKTMKERTVAMTERVYKELQGLYEQVATGEDSLVFGITDTIKKSFDSARKAAALTDLRFHDLRHCCASRLVQAGIPLAEVARILGHSQISMSFRYTNLGMETIKRAAFALDQLNQNIDGERPLIN